MYHVWITIEKEIITNYKDEVGTISEEKLITVDTEEEARDIVIDLTCCLEINEDCKAKGVDA